jgi:TctA family transporter
VPLLLGIVLGDVLERYFTLSRSIYGWSWLAKPSVIIIILIATVLIASQILRALRTPQETTETKMEVGTGA